MIETLKSPRCQVDVLAEIPYLVKKALSAVVGVKPYIFQVCTALLSLPLLALTLRVCRQYHNSSTLHLQVTDKEGKTRDVDVQGWLFNEASFVSP